MNVTLTGTSIIDCWSDSKCIKRGQLIGIKLQLFATKAYNTLPVINYKVITGQCKWNACKLNLMKKTYICMTHAIINVLPYEIVNVWMILVPVRVTFITVTHTGISSFAFSNLPVLFW
jgi:hypothetical protein